MTIDSILRKKTYPGTGVKVPYPTEFIFFKTTDINLVHVAVDGTETAPVRGTDFAVTGGAGKAGEVEFPLDGSAYPTLAVGESLIIYRTIFPIQDMDVKNFSAGNYENWEFALDRIYMAIQEIFEWKDRTLSLSLASEASAVTVSNPEEGRALIWTGSSSLENGPNANEIASAQLYAEEAEANKLAAESAREAAEEAAESVSLPFIVENRMLVAEGATPEWVLKTYAEVLALLGVVFGSDPGEIVTAEQFGEGAFVDAADQATAEAGVDDVDYITSLQLANVLVALGPAVPPGITTHCAGDDPPDGWLVRDGSELSRTTHAPLFANIGTKFGAGDGSTTFNVPDDRDLFDRGVPVGGTVGTYQADAVVSHSHTVPVASINNTGGGTMTTGTSMKINSGSSSAFGDTETRPKNRHYLPIIKY